MSQQDWMLMHRVAAGDEEAIGELYDRFGSLVYKVAWQFQPNHAEAEESDDHERRDRDPAPKLSHGRCSELPLPLRPSRRRRR